MKENNKDLMVYEENTKGEENINEENSNNEEENVNNKKEGFKKYKKLAKRIIIIGGVATLLIGGIVGGIAYKTIQGNMNYSEGDLKEVALEKVAKVENYNQDQSKKIALDKVKGEVVSVDKDIDDDNMSVTYEFKIKGKDNMLYEVEVDSNTGAIVDFESPSSDRD